MHRLGTIHLYREFKTVLCQIGRTSSFGMHNFLVELSKKKKESHIYLFAANYEYSSLFFTSVGPNSILPVLSALSGLLNPENLCDKYL